MRETTEEEYGWTEEDMGFLYTVPGPCEKTISAVPSSSYPSFVLS
jgi:hypothetical protein